MIAEPPDTSIPWHFWLLVAALVIYLGWRYVQGVQWLMGNGLTWLAVVVVAITLALIGWFGARRIRQS